MTFPQKLRGGTYGDRSGPLQNMHPMSKGWICVEGTEDCLVLNHLHLLRKGDMLGILLSGGWVSHRRIRKVCFVSVCVPDLNLLP